MPNYLLIFALWTGLGMAYTAAPALADTEVVQLEEIGFQPLNPARGDASPKAGVLWGDIRENVPSGAIIEFAEGFSSPPHIHNITYRGIVIEGAVHNADPAAPPEWMGPGSFWTQPAGATHITAAGGDAGARIFLEIISGPYLVRPVDAAFDNGERALNLDASNIVWLGADDTRWIESHSHADSAPAITFLWGEPGTGRHSGSMLRLPPGFSGSLAGDGAQMRAVTIRGTIRRHQEDLPPASYLGWRGKDAQSIECTAPDPCLVYVSAQGRYRLLESGASLSD